MLFKFYKKYPYTDTSTYDLLLTKKNDLTILHMNHFLL